MTPHYLNYFKSVPVCTSYMQALHEGGREVDFPGRRVLQPSGYFENLYKTMEE